jgi:hypothetical protein
MKSGLLNKIVHAYAPFFPRPWQRVRDEFMRREGDWVQIVAFNPSRFDDVYEPRSCFEFLKKPGPATGGFLLYPIKHPNGTQRWVRAANISDAASSDSAQRVFDEMARQFEPSILAPLEVQTIKRLLGRSLDYSPHAYALCVMAAEAGERVEAERCFRKYEAAILEIATYPDVMTERQELLECVKQSGSSDLQSKLASIAAEKLHDLRLVE